MCLLDLDRDNFTLNCVVEVQSIPSTERDLNPGPRKCTVHIPFICSLECFNDDGQPENVLSRLTEQVTVPVTLQTCVL